jgi:hypothetical protein
MNTTGAEQVRQQVAREMAAESGNGLIAMMGQVTVAWPETKLEVGDIVWYRLQVQGTPYWATLNLTAGPSETVVVESVEEALDRSDNRYNDVI